MKPLRSRSYVETTSLCKSLSLRAIVYLSVLALLLFLFFFSSLEGPFPFDELSCPGPDATEEKTFRFLDLAFRGRRPVDNICRPLVLSLPLDRLKRFQLVEDVRQSIVQLVYDIVRSELDEGNGERIQNYHHLCDFVDLGSVEFHLREVIFQHHDMIGMYL